MVYAKLLDSYQDFQRNPKITIYKVIKGKKGFNLAQHMLNWDDEKVFDNEWASKWTEQEKQNAIFIIFSKKIRVNDKIGIRLLIGNDDNFAVVGELHTPKKALLIWNDVMPKI